MCVSTLYYKVGNSIFFSCHNIFLKQFKPNYDNVNFKKNSKIRVKKSF